MATKYKNEKQFNLAGVTFDGRQGKLIALKKAVKGSYIVLKREKNNQHDPNAIAAIAVLPNGTHMKIGYVPRTQNEAIAAAIDAGGNTRVRQYSVIGGKGYNYGCNMRVAY